MLILAGTNLVGKEELRVVVVVVVLRESFCAASGCVFVCDPTSPHCGV